MSGNNDVSDGGCLGRTSDIRTHVGVHWDVYSPIKGKGPTLTYTDYLTTVRVHI